MRQKWGNAALTEFFVRQVRIGRVQPLGPRKVASGIYKRPVSAPVMAHADGISGDEQGDRRHHGGPDKAVHAYASANYPLWVADLPERVALFQPGAFGENLVVEGATEADMCLGDQWQLGGALLEVSQGRQPCWRLNLRFDCPDMARLVQQTERTGWYFRVIKPGKLGPLETATLVQRPHPGWTIARASHLLYHDRHNRTELVEFAALPGLPESWRNLAKARLRSGLTEHWTRRIVTPE